MEPYAANTKKEEPISGNLPICAFVQASHLFKDVAAPDLEHLCKVARLIKFRPDETIIHEGAPGDRLFLILAGSVRVSTRGKQGAVELGHLSRSAFFGEVACLTGRPRTADVIATTDVEVIAFDRVDVDDILKKYPKVRKLMHAVMTGRARTTIEKTVGQEGKE
jgi:CRP-like cAMP-binding protein